MNSDPDRPELTVFELGPAGSLLAGRVTGRATFRAVKPFDLEISPAALVAGLFRR